MSSIRIRKFSASSEFASSVSTFRNEFIPPYTLQNALDEVIDSEFSDAEYSGEIFYAE